MASATALAGIAYFSADGVSYNVLMEAMMYRPSTVTRESLVGADTVHGFKETIKPGGMSCTLRDAGSLSVAAFNAMRNNTIVFELANGKTITGRNMWTIDAQEVNPGEGSFEVKWEGPSVSEQLAS